jgi:large subunit ribosomal protein L29
MKASEIREMNEEQVGALLNETTERLFRLRLQAQTERLDAPSELKKHRRLVARICTVQAERTRAAQQQAAASAPQAAAGEQSAAAGEQAAAGGQ